MAEARVDRPPIDPDVDLRVARRRRELHHAPWAVLAAVSLGGAVGALARYGIAVALPPSRTGLPWATFTINVSGCLLIGMLMTLLSEAWAGHRLARPFLGVGVLGGYTTFSTYVVDIQRLVDAGAAATGLLYLVATALAALTAVYAGISMTRLALRVRPRRRR